MNKNGIQETNYNILDTKKRISLDELCKRIAHNLFQDLIKDPSIKKTTLIINKCHNWTGLLG